MDESGEGFTQHHEMQVRRGKGARQLGNRLIRQAENVAKVSKGRKFAHLRVLTASADEAELDIGAMSQFDCSLENRVERMARAVIAGVHHDIFPGQAVTLAKGIASRR